ncbi:oplophorus-luciferin 2-monooxygenase non-catalytic subunit-like [Penaeus indicus]|uniref:oplophorus-luciferin 2-monooxygenase non-catalytic subunit-like n=1 Tax=Penaeus indicus TaxID=29960 RepID=UPI00300C0393
MPVLSLLFALSALRFCEGAANNGLRALPCPDPEDIFPCVCTTGSENHMTMDCSDVASEDELARVFSSSLPFTKFFLLKIEGNQNLRVLREGDLGPASFSIININGGILEEVQYGALAGSYATAEVIDLSRNALSALPFHELPLFTSLSTVEVNGNLISAIPVLQSASLTGLDLRGNLINEFPVDCFKELINVMNIFASGNNIETIFPETFANLPLLNYVDLSDNTLSNIPKGAIAFISTDKGYINLRSNIISNIEVNAITGLNAGTLYLNGNSLSVLEEDVFRPILEGGATVYLNENPLQCGCDVAWLVTNPALLALIPKATCYNGESLEDLDPSIFEDLC